MPINSQVYLHTKNIVYTYKVTASFTVARPELFTVAAVAHAIPLHSTPGLAEDVVVVVVQDPLMAVAVVDHGAHAK